MNRKVCYLIIIGILQAMGLWASKGSYSTHRLEAIAQCLTLPQIDTLGNGMSTYNYHFKNKPLHIRRNQYGEIEHIGLLLFSNEWRELRPSPVYDFLERALLERNLPNLDDQLRFHLLSEKVTFVKGHAQTVFKFKGDEAFSEECMELKVYSVSWSTPDGRELLKIDFNMDIELLSGCNSTELEAFFIKQLERYQDDGCSTIVLGNIRTDRNEYVEKRETFLIKEMKADLYFSRDQQGWQLTMSDSSPAKALSNLMLTGRLFASPTLLLTIDKYGYTSEQMQVAYAKFVNVCIEDGCTPYFAIKGRNGREDYTGTLLLVNRTKGYVHMLIASVPALVLKRKGEGTIQGRLYLYIPMHNVSNQYFQTSQPIN